jgi:hypothetical protein
MCVSLLNSLFKSFRFPKNKQKYIQDVYDEITDKLAQNKSSIITGLYGIQDSYYRIIL